MREWRSDSKTYPLEVSMNDSTFVDVDQTPSGVSQLDESSDHMNLKQRERSGEKHTSFNRSASGFASTNSLRFPLTIQTEIMANLVSVIVTPISGRTLGCRRVFHVMASLQNLYTGDPQCSGSRRVHHRQLTPITFPKSLFENVLMTFTATSRPRYCPFHTSAYPPLYSALPVGS